MNRVLVVFFSFCLFISCDDNPGPIQVATPQFSISGGTYETPQTIIISTATPGADIRYTLDGSDPESGTLFRDSIVFDQPGNYLIKANAKKANYEISDIAILELNLIIPSLNFPDCRISSSNIFGDFRYDEEGRIKDIFAFSEDRLEISYVGFEYLEDEIIIHKSNTDSGILNLPTRQPFIVLETHEELITKIEYLEGFGGDRFNNLYYDENWRLLSNVNWHGDSIVYTWDDYNIISSVNTKTGNNRTYEFDDKGNPFLGSNYWLAMMNYLYYNEDDLLLIFFNSNNMTRSWGSFWSYSYTFENEEDVYPISASMIDTLPYGGWGITLFLQYECFD